MFILKRTTMKTFRNVGTLLAVTIVFYGLYCRHINSDLRRLVNITSKRRSNDSTKCKLKWNNPKVGVDFYETRGPAHSDRMLDKLITRPKPVRILYPNTVIRLKTEKFLLPIVYNGPNNQLTGLREATFVAIKLNRTLVIPRFFKHSSDSSATRGDWFIFPGHRFSTESYCRFVSCVTIEQFQEACGHKVDALMHLQTYTPADIRKWESYTGMRIARKESTREGLNVRLIPPDPLSKGERHRTFRSKDINSLFESEDRCVLYPRPLYNLHLHAMVVEKDNFEVELVKTQQDIYRLPESRLFLSICDASGSPNYIKNIAKEFSKSFMKRRPFLSLHWRYNKDDFMKRCNSNEGNKLKMKLCSVAMQITPEDIARSIEQKIAELSENYKNIKIKDVYIASPPSERKLVADIARFLFDKHGWATHSSLDLEKFMNNRYSNCDIIEKHFNDIVSTTEMEICRLGTAFLGSVRSSWSGNVLLARKARKVEGTLPHLDGDIFKMSLSVMESEGDDSEDPNEET